MQQTLLSFEQFIATAENRSAMVAVQEVAENLAADQPLTANPWLLHGPTGTGKTHLVSALVQQVLRARPRLVIAHLPAGDFTLAGSPSQETSNRTFALARDNDLLIVEDLQHLHASAIGPFTELVDELLACGQPMIFTADAGPQELREEHHFPVRLVSRLTGGMVVGLEPLGEQGRLSLLRARCSQMKVGEDTLAWLARNLTGGVRQLFGAVRQLELLSQAGQPMDQKTVARQFQVQADCATTTVEIIARQVSQYFRVEPNQLCSRRRSRHVLVPRQVSMYLARQLTPLSLDQIGEFFGGRDHSTVLHACRKVEQALSTNLELSGAVRELEAQLA
jgi:chromosomal replication initiator protein